MECRICFEDDTNETLFSPCKCSGTMRWVHNSCLQKWIHIKKNSRCPVCKEHCVIEKTKKQQIASYIVKSNFITSLIAAIFGFFLLLFTLHLNISMNILVITFMTVVFGIHYIQEYFEHEEINMETVFDTIALYTSRGQFHNGDGLTVIFSCLWLLVDNLKYRVLVPYL